jgi:fluoride ion exporter CrcB/FEX
MKLILAIAFGGAVGSVGHYYIADLSERCLTTFLGASFFPTVQLWSIFWAHSYLAHWSKVLP